MTNVSALIIKWLSYYSFLKGVCLCVRELSSVLWFEVSEVSVCVQQIEIRSFVAELIAPTCESRVFLSILRVTFYYCSLSDNLINADGWVERVRLPPSRCVGAVAKDIRHKRITILRLEDEPKTIQFPGRKMTGTNLVIIFPIIRLRRNEYCQNIWYVKYCDQG